MRPIAGIIMLMLLPLAACGDEEEPDVGDEPTTVITDRVPEEPRQVATWSEAQAREQAAWLQSQSEPRLLEGTEAEQFVQGIPPELRDSADDLTSLSLDQTALLVAGFAECGNAGSASIEGSTVTYHVRKVDDRQCVWAPTRVQVFAVAPGLTLAR